MTALSDVATAIFEDSILEPIIAVIGACVIAFLVFTTLIKLVKTTLKTAFLLAVVMLLLMFFGIGPNEVWDVFAGWLGMGPDPANAPPVAPAQ